MSTASNNFLDKISNSDNASDLGFSAPSFPTAKKNYDCIKLSNRHGSISFGHIHQKGDVVSSVLLQGQDGSHFITMDQTTGNTTSVSPGAFNLRSGVGDIEPEGDSLVFHAEQGNIIIKADAGDITLIGDSINLHAVGAEGKGHVTITGSESVTVDAKKVLVNAKSMFKIASPGTGEIIANSVLKMYGSLVKGVTDGCSLKDGKYGGMAFQKMNTLL